MTKWGQRDATSWPQISEANAELQIPSFEREDPPESHRGAMSQKKRAREKVRDKRDPGKHVTESENMEFPLGEKAHLPRDVEEAARSTSENQPHFLKDF